MLRRGARLAVGLEAAINSEWKGSGCPEMVGVNSSYYLQTSYEEQLFLFWSESWGPKGAICRYVDVVRKWLENLTLIRP